MKGSEIRQAFLDYFKSKDHEIVPSSSLVPLDDPTILFTNAGMNQFKDCFLGAEKRSYTRASTCQKCLRISGKHNDLENVGVTARHHTFFEMLGNFSFGDYFKADAISFGWEFSTKILKLDKSKIWVTVFEKDDEAAELWRTKTDIDPSRILRMTEKDNFWAMGDTGPCGPCSELYYYVGNNPEAQSEAEFRKDDGTYLEYWNLVFMQFDRAKDGTLNPLPKPAVDTGMGLERITSILQGVKSTYDTDLLKEVITLCEKLTGHKYDGTSYEVRDLKKDLAYARDVAMRVIADHSRSAAFLIADGINPGNDGRGYVLRRVMRRAIRHGRVLGFKEPFLAKTTSKVVEVFGSHYPELKEKADFIARIVDAEERKFHETLDSGLAILQKEVEKLPEGEPFPGEIAFLLHDTYGFPLDLTEDALKIYDRKVDSDGFNRSMSEQKKRSREERKSQNITFTSVKLDSAPTKFLGYETSEAPAKLLHILPRDGDIVPLIFDVTPFYAESGGQVGDTGSIKLGDVILEVQDTQKIRDGHFVHYCTVLKGELTDKLIGTSAELKIDLARRNRIKANHSATHLLHSALRRTLGDHVKQAGSRVDEVTLRFDYSHFEPLSESVLQDIQSIVNEEIRKNYSVVTESMKIDEAKQAGAMALFGEKYGDTVRVITIGPNSKELCGGTHVSRSGDIGVLLVSHDSGISAGVRRIECWAGESAHEEILKVQSERSQIASILKSGIDDLPDKIEKTLAKNRSLERELETLRARLASASSGDLMGSARTTPRGIKVIAEKVDVSDTETLRSMVDGLKVKIGSGVVALASSQGDSGIIIAGVTSDLTSSVNAGNLVKEAAKVSGGRGGGRADFAQAGGVDPTKIGAALTRFVELLS